MPEPSMAVRLTGMLGVIIREYYGQSNDAIPEREEAAYVAALSQALIPAVRNLLDAMDSADRKYRQEKFDKHFHGPIMPWSLDYPRRLALIYLRMQDEVGDVERDYFNTWTGKIHDADSSGH